MHNLAGCYRGHAVKYKRQLRLIKLHMLLKKSISVQVICTNRLFLNNCLTLRNN